MNHVSIKDPRRISLPGTIGIILVGLFSISYSLWLRNFSEIHIQFSFLNFPIFISEWLFLACVLLFIWKWDREELIANRWYYFVLLYVGWLFVKVLHGYMTAGPLALRHAMLFCYPLFAVLT